MKRWSIVITLVGIVVLALSSTSITKTTLRLWDIPNGRIQEFMTEAIEDWNKEHPEIKVDYTVISGAGIEPWMKIGASIAAGEGPDVAATHIRVSDDWTFAGLMAPIPESVWSKDYIEENFPGTGIKWFQWDIEAGTFGADDGEYYLLPWSTQMAVLDYNVDLVEEVGIDPAQLEGNLTWDRLIAIAQKSTKRTSDGNLTQAGFTYEGHGWVWWQAITYSLGGHLFKPADNISGYVSNADSFESLKALQLLWDIVNKYKLFDPGFMSWIEAFGTEKTAMTSGWGWVDYYMKDNFPNVNYRGAVMPTFSGLPPYGMARPAPWYGVPNANGNPNYSKDEETIWKFFKEFMLSDNVIDGIGYSTGCIPTYKPIMDNPERMEKYFTNSTFSAQLKMLPYTVFAGDEINEEFMEAINLEERMLYQNMAPSEAVKEYIQNVNKLLAEKKIWITQEG